MEKLSPEAIDDRIMAILFAKIQATGVTLDLNEPYVILAKIRRSYSKGTERISWNGQPMLGIKRTRTEHGIVWDVFDQADNPLTSFLQDTP